MTCPGRSQNQEHGRVEHTVGAGGSGWPRGWRSVRRFGATAALLGLMAASCGVLASPVAAGQGVGPQPTGPVDLAIMIGVSHYRHLGLLPEVEMAEQGAGGMLAAKGYQVYILVDPTPKEFQALILGLAPARSHQRYHSVVLYVAGISAMEIRPPTGEVDVALLTSGAREASLNDGTRSECLSLREMALDVSRLRGDRSFIVFDSLLPVMPEADAEAVSQALSACPPGLRIAVLASGDGAQLRPGLPALYPAVLHGILEGAADTNRDGSITSEEARAFLGENTPGETAWYTGPILAFSASARPEGVLFQDPKPRPESGLQMALPSLEAVCKALGQPDLPDGSRLTLIGEVSRREPALCETSEPQDTDEAARWQDWRGAMDLSVSDVIRRDALSTFVEISAFCPSLLCPASLEEALDQGAASIARWLMGRGVQPPDTRPLSDYSSSTRDVLLHFGSPRMRQLCQWPELWDAISEGDMKAFHRQVDGGVTGLRDIWGRTALHVACCHGRLDVAKDLLALGCDINAVDGYGTTPAFYAAAGGYSDLVLWLLKHGARWNEMEYSRFWRRRTGAELLDRIPQSEVDWDTWVDLVRSGRPALLQKLVARGFARRLSRASARELLEVAAAFDRFEMVESMLTWDPWRSITGLGNDPPSPGDSPEKASDAVPDPIRLCLAFGAARHGHAKALPLLVRSGEVRETLKGTGWTLLHAAAAEGQTEVAEVVLAMGADIGAPDSRGLLPVHLALESGHAALGERLLSLTVTRLGEEAVLSPSLLLAAASGGDEEVVRRCLEHGVPADPGGTRCWTALHRAAMNGHEAVVSLLLDHGAKIDAADPRGRTALLLAASRGQQNVVELLIGRGADPSIRDDEGSTFLHAAALGGSARWVDWALSHGFRPNARDSKGRTPLHWAAACGYGGSTLLLIWAGADPNIPDEDGMTPLHRATEGGHLEVARLLLENGADGSRKDVQGWKAPRLAQETYHPEMVGLFRPGNTSSDGSVPKRWKTTSWAAISAALLCSSVFLLLMRAQRVRLFDTSPRRWAALALCLVWPARRMALWLILLAVAAGVAGWFMLPQWPFGQKMTKVTYRCVYDPGREQLLHERLDWEGPVGHLRIWIWGDVYKTRAHSNLAKIFAAYRFNVGGPFRLEVAFPADRSEPDGCCYAFDRRVVVFTSASHFDRLTALHELGHLYSFAGRDEFERMILLNKVQVMQDNGEWLPCFRGLERFSRLYSVEEGGRSLTHLEQVQAVLFEYELYDDVGLAEWFPQMRDGQSLICGSRKEGQPDRNAPQA